MEFIVIVESVERVAVFQDTVAKALRMVNEGLVGFDESWRLGQVSMEVAILVTEWTINDHHPYNMLMGCICRHYLFLLKQTSAYQQNCAGGPILAEKKGCSAAG
jgi:hypothetical protein